MVAHQGITRPEVSDNWVQYLEGHRDIPRAVNCCLLPLGRAGACPQRLFRAPASWRPGFDFAAAGRHRRPAYDTIIAGHPTYGSKADYRI